MSDHEELADRAEAEADKLERESERVAEQADAARDKTDAAHSDSMIPEPLGDRDPAHREPSEAERLGDGFVERGEDEDDDD